MSDNNDMSMQVGRHVHWSLTAIFSTVALCALVTEWTGKVSDQERDTKWAVSAISINLALSWVSVMANMFLSSNFVGTMMEGGLVRRIVPMFSTGYPRQHYFNLYSTTPNCLPFIFF